MDEAQYELEHEGCEYVAKFRKISLKEMAEHSDMIDAKDYNGYLIAVYLYDETALHIALQEVDDQSLAVGMIYLDNYDEALESVEEVRRSLLIALIDRKVNKYISALDGISKKLEKDKYLVILRKKAIAKLQETRFDLLEEVKTVNIGNEMAVTISIGIGLDGLTYAQNYEFSRNAIDLALGRGGDQAVIKTPESITYYGGKSQQMEKNTRVKARVKAQALKELIEASSDVLIMGHSISDADCIGASVGIYRAARTSDKDVHIVLNTIANSIKPLLNRLAEDEEYGKKMFINNETAIQRITEGTLLIVVDNNRPSRTECPQLLQLAQHVVVLDHHRQSRDCIEGAVLSYVEPYASSASEMVAEILQYYSDSIKIRPTDADAMYSGIVVDTNNFMNNTGVRTFEAAAFLRRNGADITRVRKLFRDDMEDYKAKAEAVREVEMFHERYAISVCPSDMTGNPTVIAAQAANELLNLPNLPDSGEFVPINHTDIVLQDVSFSYDGTTQNEVLHGISLNMPQGSFTALVGPSGGGKSTVARLIARFWDVTGGSISIGGVDVRDYDLETLRNSVAMVLQKNELFSGTIAENLRWGNKDATDAEIEDACKQACADEFIERFPDKYNTHIDQGGANVSGGQKQRLCIARALLKKPRILILDDSTSAVDTGTDAKIRKSFAEKIPGTTVFIIAQRISSVENADHVIVLDNGKISGYGTPAEMLATNPIYQEVYNSQTKGSGDFDEKGGDNNG